jgi:hypothetical protein
MIDCEDLFEGAPLPVTLAFFVQPANRREAETLRLGAERTGLADLARQVIQWRRESCGQVNRFSYEDGSDLREAFTSVQREHDRRLDQRRTERRYDVELRGGRLRCHPSAFAKLALAERGLLRQVQGLNGKAAIICRLRCQGRLDNGLQHRRHVVDVARSSVLFRRPGTDSETRSTSPAATRPSHERTEHDPERTLSLLV